MKFAVCNEMFVGWDFSEVVNFVAESGYDGVEIAPFTLADSVTEISRQKRREIKRTAQNAGIEITGLHWLLTKPEGLHITHPDRRIREKTLDYLARLIEFCADVGGKILVFGSPKQRDILPGVQKEEGWKYAVEVFAACAGAAKKQDVVLCLEALPANSTNLLNTNSEVLAMVEEIGHPNIRMMLDVKSMCAEGIPLRDNILNCREYFHHVHANDANKKGPGFGDVDFVPIFKTLKELNYDGFVSVEVFDNTPGPEKTAVESLCYMKECIRKTG